MRQRMMYCFLAMIVATAGAGEMINVRGKITAKNDAPVSGAIVALLGQGLADTTTPDGTYAITKNSVPVVRAFVPENERITLTNGVLELRLKKSSPVTVALYDVNGKLLEKEVVQDAAAGVYRLNVAKHCRATNLVVVQASIGKRIVTFRYLPLHNGNHTASTTGAIVTPDGGRLAKIAAVADSIEVTAAGYTKKTVAIASYDTTVDLVLDSAGTMCEGCGKTDHPASGKASIDVDGTTREYMLKLPDSYDPGKQYMLIFFPHWLGGSMDDVVSGDLCGGPYYGLDALSEGKAIFVAPQGMKETSGPFNGMTGFANTNGRDIGFFRAMLAHFNATLCIDQQRIFSTGFSFGGMMSFAVGCAMNDVFRAIAPMSGAFVSGCDSSSRSPIAVLQIHGVDDGMVPIASAKAARDYFLALNGCKEDSTEAYDPSPCVKYKCMDGYPYVYCEFDEPGEHHGVRDWAAETVWTFFSQF